MLKVVDWIIWFTFWSKSNVLTIYLPSGQRIYILFLLQVRFVAASVRWGRCTVEVGSFVLSIFLTSGSLTGQLLAPWSQWYIKRLLMYEDRVKFRYSRFLPFVIDDFYYDCFDQSWLFPRNRDETMWLANRLSLVSWHCWDHTQLSLPQCDVASVHYVIRWSFNDPCVMFPKLPVFYSICKLFEFIVIYIIGIS